MQLTVCTLCKVTYLNWLARHVSAKCNNKYDFNHKQVVVECISTKITTEQHGGRNKCHSIGS